MKWIFSMENLQHAPLILTTQRTHISDDPVFIMDTQRDKNFNTTVIKNNGNRSGS